jgi:uncharacterized protein
MSEQLPETADFLKQAERNVSLEGDYPLARLERLSAALCDTTGVLHARLNFGSTAGFHCLQGTVEANLELTCQRCMNPMTYGVSGRFKFGLVLDEEEMQELPADLEPYLIEGDEQSIVDVLEDELLLSLPIAAMHDEECSEFLRKHNEQKQAEKEASSPFAVLKGMKVD